MIETVSAQMQRHAERFFGVVDPGADRVRRERERRANVAHARGELEAAESLGQAAERLEEHPASLQLRTLSTLAEIAVEKNSTIVFPLPFEVVRVFEALAHRLEATTAAPAPAPSGPPTRTSTAYTSAHPDLATAASVGNGGSTQSPAA